MKFVFIRHSKTKIDPNVPILLWGLSDNGIEFAKELGQNEIFKKIKVVYSSLQTKALETSVIICKPNQISIKTDNRLTEVTSFTGPFELDDSIHTKNIHDYHKGLISRINNGETKIEALKRFNESLTDISITEKTSDYVGIVSHGNMLALFSSQYQNIDSYELHTKIKQPDMAIFDFEPKKFITFFGDQ